MTIYDNHPSRRRRIARSFKWVIAAIVFILAMTITWSDVEGQQVPRDRDQVAIDHNQVEHERSPRVTAEGTDIATGDETPPSSIPEPGTLILLGGGLAAMYLVRRRRNRKLH
jgi:hypothetical protein